MKFLLLLSSLFIIFACNNAKSYNEHRLSKIPPQLLRQDIDFTYKKLQELHPKLYWYISEKEIKNKFDSLKRSINKPLNPVEFYFKLQPVITQIREGHLNLQMPGKRFSKKEIKRLKDSKGLFSRFEYYVQDDHLYFVENKDSLANIQPGTELLSINDVPVRDYLNKYKKLINSDGLNTTFLSYYLKDAFFNFFVAEKGILDSAKIKTLYNNKEKWVMLKREYKSASEIEKDQENKKRNQEKKVNDYVPFNNSYNRNFKFVESDSSVAYIKIKTFSDSFSDDFYKQSFTKIKDANSKFLIIDIRNNYGGAINEINNLYSYLASKPFVLIKPSQLTSTNAPLKNNYFKKTNALQFFANIVSYPGYFIYQSFKSYKGKDGIAYYKMKENKTTKPKNEAFKGKVYVLINGASFSASSILAAKLKFDKRATLVGEETGGANDGTVAGFYSYQQLPNSKINFPIGLLLVQPNIDLTHTKKGVIPDVEITETIQNIIDKKDPALEWVKNEISNSK